MNVKTCFFGPILLASAMMRAQAPEIVQAYIDRYKDVAVAEMQRSGIPASIILAQGIHETEAGTSELVLRSNNHFGIKCKAEWTGDVVYHDDDARGECFRSYDKPEDSYRDHSEFLRGSPRYARLFRLKLEDYTGWAQGLKKAGYATNPRYPQILIHLIEEYRLERYTLIAMGKLAPDGSNAPVTDNPGTTAVTEDATTGEPAAETPGAAIDSANRYPEGLFRINFTKVVFARTGMSMLALSNQYDVPLPRLFEFNEMPEADVLGPGQLIFLQRKRKTGINPYHVVVPGESLYLISQREGIRYESLLELNQLQRGEEPATGERISLQRTAPGKPVVRNLGSR